MAEEKNNTKGNVVMAKFKKDQNRENKDKKWNKVSDAVSAARQAYVGSYNPDPDEKTVNFEKALGDLIEVLGKIKSGSLKLGGLGDSKGIEIADEG